MREERDRAVDRQHAHVEEWRLIRIADEGTRHLVGFVTGHPHLRDRARIVTSAVVRIDRNTAETQNTTYSLGRRGEGPLPEDWASAIDRFLQIAWGTSLVTDQ